MFSIATSAEDDHTSVKTTAQKQVLDHNTSYKYVIITSCVPKIQY